MMTKDSQRQQQELNEKPSLMDMSAPVVGDEQVSGMIEKTKCMAAKEENMTVKKMVDVSACTSSGMMCMDAKEQNMPAKTTVDVSSCHSNSDNSKVNECFMKLLASFSTLETLYNERMKGTVDKFIQDFQNVPVSYETHIKPNLGNMHMIHSVFMIFGGGSWYSVALLFSFYDVYTVDIREKLESSFGWSMLDADENHIMEAAHNLYVLLVIFYAVWTVPFLASMTIAFVAQKYITQTVMTPAVMNLLEKRIPLTKILGRWVRLVVSATAVLLVLLLPLNMQACFLMSCLGYEKLLSVVSDCSRKKITSFEGPNNLDGKTMMLWICVMVSTVWQLLNGFQASMIGVVIPLGFLIPQVAKMEGTKQE